MSLTFHAEILDLRQEIAALTRERDAALLAYREERKARHDAEAALKAIAELQELNSVPIPRYEQARTMARRALEKGAANV